MMTCGGFLLCWVAGVRNPAEVAQSAPVEERLVHTTQWQTLLPIKKISGWNPRRIATYLLWLGEWRFWSAQAGLQGRRKGKSCLQTASFGKHRWTGGNFKIKIKMVLLKGQSEFFNPSTFAKLAGIWSRLKCLLWHLKHHWEFLHYLFTLGFDIHITNSLG